MPKGHALYMDVKFPMASYLRYLEVGHRRRARGAPQELPADVRLRVKELAKREYAAIGEQPAVDYVLLFIPNEQLTGFIHEHDPDLLDDAMNQQVVMCSPLTLFAFLGVIRQAFDNFMIEQTSDEILQADRHVRHAVDEVHRAGRLGQEAIRLCRQGVRRADRDPTTGAREAVAPTRGDSPPTRNLPVDGELFAVLDEPDDDDADDDPPARHAGAPSASSAPDAPTARPMAAMAARRRGRSSPA